MIGEGGMLVYEFVGNGDLEQWLHGDVGPLSPLTRDMRMQIITDTAKWTSELQEIRDTIIGQISVYLNQTTVVDMKAASQPSSLCTNSKKLKSFVREAAFCCLHWEIPFVDSVKKNQEYQPRCKVDRFSGTVWNPGKDRMFGWMGFGRGQIEVNHNKQKLENLWSSSTICCAENGPRLEDNVNLNHQIIWSHSHYLVLQNFNLNNSFVDHGHDSFQVTEDPNGFRIPGMDTERSASCVANLIWSFLELVRWCWGTMARDQAALSTVTAHRVKGKTTKEI
ncbi:hypothetical protein OROHE_006863 [Orobanche hederae]